VTIAQRGCAIAAHSLLRLTIAYRSWAYRGWLSPGWAMGSGVSTECVRAMCRPATAYDVAAFYAAPRL